MEKEIERICFAIFVLARAIENGKISGVVEDMEEILKRKVEFTIPPKK
jgi:hypothetical protein